MKTLFAIIQKEMRQLRRNTLLLVIICVSPVIILGIIPFSLEKQVKINLSIVDQDKTATSRMMAYRMQASPFYSSVASETTLDGVLSRIRKNKSDIALVIPENFERDADLGNQEPLFLTIDGTHTLNAQSHLAFLEEALQSQRSGGKENGLAEVHYLFNPELDGRIYFIVSLLILLVTLIGVCLITINIVSEKESGMWSQLQATPLSLLQYLAAKLVVFAAVGLAEMIIGLAFCRAVYSFVVLGPISDYLLLTLIFLFPMLMLGIFIASITKNQVQAVYMLVLVLLSVILMSTMFSFLNAMPDWAQKMRFLNPLYYMLDASRLMVLKGFSLATVWVQTGILVFQGIVLSVATLLIFRSPSSLNQN